MVQEERTIKELQDLPRMHRQQLGDTWDGGALIVGQKQRLKEGDFRSDSALQGGRPEPAVLDVGRAHR